MIQGKKHTLKILTLGAGGARGAWDQDAQQLPLDESGRRGASKELQEGRSSISPGGQVAEDALGDRVGFHSREDEGL